MLRTKIVIAALAALAASRAGALSTTEGAQAPAPAAEQTAEAARPSGPATGPEQKNGEQPVSECRQRVEKDWQELQALLQQVL